MMNPEHLNRKLQTLSYDWALAEKEAQEAELDAKQQAAKLWLVYRETSKTAEEARNRVDASDVYFESQTLKVEARHRANLTKRALEDYERTISVWQTNQKTERELAKVAT